MEKDIITHDLLKSWSPCADGFKRFCQLFPEGADLETAINGLVNDDHNDWGYWLFDKCLTYGISKTVTAKGYRNSGDRNSGHRNSGNWNSGHRNSGDRNSGNWNSGNWNSGHRNSGDRNSGNWNSGHWNSGDRNSGNWNSGNWNSGDLNSGFFNTTEPKDILVFGKLINKKDFDNCYKPSFLYFELTYWVDESSMTDEDKIKDPMFYVRGGQLRKRDYKEEFKLSWDKADKNDRIRIKDIPNFDKQMFFEISGIDVDKD